MDSRIIWEWAPSAVLKSWPPLSYFSNPPSPLSTDMSFPSFSESTTWAIVFVFVCAAFHAYRLLTTSRPHFPPGPKAVPFLGNLLQIPSEHPEERFAEWGNEYGLQKSQYFQCCPLTKVPGDVIYIQILGQPIVVLNSLQAARDLMEKRGSIYSDRPRFVLFSELYVTYFDLL